MSALSKLITPVSDADKAAFEKITSERTDFDTPAPMTPLERVELLASSVLRDLAEIVSIMETHETKVDFGSTERLMREAEDRAMTALVQSTWMRTRREAGLL